MTAAGSSPDFLLACWFDVPATSRPEFRAKTADRVLADQKTLAGFKRAGRFEAVEGEPSDLALVQLTQMPAREAIASAEEKLASGATAGGATADSCLYRLRSSEGSNRELFAPFALVVRMIVRPGGEGIFRDWLDGEHAIRQTQVPGALFYRGYEPVNGPFHFLNIFGLETASVASSDAWEAARETKWRHTAHAELTSRRRTVFKRVGP